MTADLKIDRQLYLVMPLVQGGRTVHVHAAAISVQTFEQYYDLLSRVFSRIYARQLGYIGGPRVAALILRDLAKSDGSWEEVQRGLIAEMHRLTNVIVPTDKGYESLPFDDAVRRNELTAEDVSETDNAIVFFSVMYRMHRHTERQSVLQVAAELWDARVESLNATDYRVSLQTLTQDASTTASAD